ncbi:UDP-glucose/GDP-mannose dehydrogenase family protein [Amycolatopsis acidiphila]|uniref:UDP-glucose 6-dehydrogenase n=1 Tax=Amycolatopsis acidiphila TaxID=715473 RepID=A0A558AFT0_9PSEU|nr:UDP-glucose/GDP-mannose dehydrogenase family protein [Amycolatopsis acidiphila]TVT23119.1 UDP-glucose/GDP-mannose dehydrogenase family protein [Amycolatopsis acidiphila]UIJ60195.1 UDP-glucose/GDP-mannose dehydrogenase family protein [Amycolatopsis acidiphila]GHG60845.1 UDP-glucose 6-dehydrogenase [Amycolatopsis acidiphila]
MGSARIVVIGTGYVGLTTGACLAGLGHQVTCVDVDEMKVARLAAGRVDILEPGLEELVSRGLATGRLGFVVGSRRAVADAQAVFLCVPTPMGAGGAADLRAVEAVIDEISGTLPAGCAVVTKSTVPVGTAQRIRGLLGRADVPVVANPEFLREGTAVADFLNPDRIVVGSDDEPTARWVAELYADLAAPSVVTDAASAELVKYAANCFLAMKLSYVNAVAELCERLGADIESVTDGMGYDRRIGRSFLKPGPGWGGSCLPKDTHALVQVAESVGFDFSLLSAAIGENIAQRDRIVAKIAGAVGGSLAGARIGVLGLAFKAGTNDLRDSPALSVTAMLAAHGAEVTAYDPAVGGDLPGMRIVDDPYQTAKGADAIVVLTEWAEFRNLDWTYIADLMHGDAVVDTRNLLDPKVVLATGLTWLGLGRPRARVLAR